MTGIRGRLLATVVGLVAMTSLILGAGAYGYVATSLRDQHLAEARLQTNFNVAVLAADALPTNATRDDLAQSGLLERIQLRGSAGTLVDFGDGDPYASGLAFAGALRTLSEELQAIVAAGQIGYQRLDLDQRPFLAMGARLPPGGPDFYFFYDASGIEAAIARLGQALLAGGVLLVALAVLASGAVARGILRPVREAGAAAERIAGGDLSARLPQDSGDEFGAWAASFNHMAGSLDETIRALREAQSRQRAFVADVSHELRTPLTALVQEAALLRDHLHSMPPDGRRAGELLVRDVARLRTLVDDLMEVSRFDAAAEVVVPVEFELGSFLRAVAAARAPGARVSLASDGALTLVSDRRRLERIVANLLDNAREHAGSQEVEVSAGMAAGHLRIAVADRGPAVPVDELPHLFERFHKADPSRHLGGSGLGLALAREHAALLGGTLEASLRPGGGMRFDLDLPVTGSLRAGDGGVTGSTEAGITPETAAETPT
jgi:signal transduction histidine kinase